MSPVTVRRDPAAATVARYHWNIGLFPPFRVRESRNARAAQRPEEPQLVAPMVIASPPEMNGFGLPFVGPGTRTVEMAT